MDKFIFVFSVKDVCASQMLYYLTKKSTTQTKLEKEYVCKTCHIKMKKSQVPCQAVYNTLFVDDIPEEMSCLNQLGLFLIRKRFLFKKY